MAEKKPMKKFDRLQRFCLFLLAAALIVPTGCGESMPPQNTVSRKGMVVSVNDLATRVGVDILRQGGNAVDAAIGVGFALAVVYPEAGNLGGGGFMVIRFPDRPPTSIDFRETAPSAAHRDMYLTESGAVDPEKSLRGYLAAGVPGTVKGLELAHRLYGRMPWKRLVQPAVELAEQGFRLSEDQARSWRNMAGAFPSTFRVFGHAWDVFARNERFCQPDLAQTLIAIRDEGDSGFYTGRIAELIEADMKRNGGLVTVQDLAGYRAVERQPIIGSYRGYEVISMPPPSSGGIALIEMLNILEGYNLADLGPESPETVHRVVEAMRLAFADRALYLGDPDFVDIPVEKLTDKTYADELLSQIQLGVAGRSSMFSVSARGSFFHESHETTHYSIADSTGLTVAVTTTLNGVYGSLAVVDSAGFLLNNEMDDFTAKPGEPNLYGLIQGTANAIEPHKRMLSSMTPTIVVRDSQLVLAAGSPGGPTIINTVLQVLLHSIDFESTIDEAVSAPRFHHQWFPDVIDYESDRFDPLLLRQLEEWGYSLNPVTSLGKAHALAFDALNKTFRGAADPRGKGSARGY
ncbi:gamma-glutamyltransferase [candidate division KSB1 bacterium]|nr:gamma-glutamyltransferase [candidate division KSB1 bacterium]